MRVGRYSTTSNHANSQLDIELLTQNHDTWISAAQLLDYGQFSVSSVLCSNVNASNAVVNCITNPQLTACTASISALQNTNFLASTQASILYANVTSSALLSASLSGLSSQFQTLSSLYAFKADVSTLSALYAGQTLVSALSGSVSALQAATYLSSTQASNLYADFTSSAQIASSLSNLHTYYIPSGSLTSLQTAGSYALASTIPGLAGLFAAATNPNIANATITSFTCATATAGNLAVGVTQGACIDLATWHSGKASNAGQISYGRFGGNPPAMELVGYGTSGSARSVRIWDNTYTNEVHAGTPLCLGFTLPTAR